MQNRFNLVDEPWIPITDVGRISLRQLFSEPDYRALGGDPIQKISLMKFLLAIAQAACTPQDNREWESLGASGVASKCLGYLERWYERFYLYGERPFLQMPAISAARVQSFGTVLPDIATGNTTILHHSQVEHQLDDAHRAVLLIGLMCFALSGKQTDNTVVLTPGYTGKTNEKGKPRSGRAGPSLAHLGLLHSFLVGKTLWQTLWFNLFGREQLERAGIFPQGVGVPPWEEMPVGEDCDTARRLKESLMGRLIPLCRFCLLTGEGLHYSEGIVHPGYREGMADPSVAVDYSGKEPRALWSNPEKRPWRELTSLLSFFSQQDSKGLDCWQLRVGMSRLDRLGDVFAVWSGGLRVSSNAGEQYASGTDDFVESQVWLHPGVLDNFWFTQLKAEMDGLDALARALYGQVAKYFKELKMDGAKIAAQCVNVFWQLCERDFQELVNCCDADTESTKRRYRLRRRFARNALDSFDRFCPNETARQLDAWASCRPNFGKYLKQEA